MIPRLIFLFDVKNHIYINFFETHKFNIKKKIRYNKTFFFVKVREGNNSNNLIYKISSNKIYFADYLLDKV